MRRRRFRASETSRTVQYEGVITLTDLRKKFNIPAHAEVFIEGNGYRERVDVDVDTPLKVSWQEVK